MKWTSRSTILLLVCGLFSGGCSVMRALDFGGDDKKPWEFRFGWERGIEHSTAKPGEVDPCGVYQPEDPSVEAALNFPDISAGMLVEIQPTPKISPTVQVEFCEFKVPYLRWFSVQVGAGTQMVDLYIGKRLISVFEVTVGPWAGWDFDAHKVAWGVGGTLIRF